MIQFQITIVETEKQAVWAADWPELCSPDTD